MTEFIKSTLNYRLDDFTTLPFEELDKWEVGKAVIKGAVNHWEPLGFLDGITNERKKQILAVAYDNITHDLLSENERVIKIAKRYDFNCTDENNSFFDFNVMIYAVLRRVICGAVGQSDGAKKFSYKKFLDYLEDYSFLAINFDDFERDIDAEAEFCAILASRIEDRFDNEKNED